VTFEEPAEFIERRIRMSHVSQPLLIKSLVATGVTATLRQVALAFLAEDEWQIVPLSVRVR
jgi:hypothetical protein